jgi:hypothetical protein
MSYRKVPIDAADDGGGNGGDPHRDQALFVETALRGVLFYFSAEPTDHAARS